MPARYSVDPREVELKAIRAQGPGGQNVNKVSSAVQLRFDVAASSLPQGMKDRLLALADHRIGDDGVVVIKAQSHRSQQRNRDEAVQRLEELLQSVAHAPCRRRPTRPTLASRQRRLQAKAERARIKAGRGKADW